MQAVRDNNCMQAVRDNNCMQAVRDNNGMHVVSKITQKEISWSEHIPRMVDILVHIHDDMFSYEIAHSCMCRHNHSSLTYFKKD